MKIYNSSHTQLYIAALLFNKGVADTEDRFRRNTVAKAKRCRPLAWGSKPQGF